MQEPQRSLQVLPLEVLLTREAPPAEDVAQRLRTRLNGLPFVLKATWSSQVVEDDGDRYLRGVVWMLPMAELPEDDPELKAFYDCFAVPGVVGPDGSMPATVAQQTKFVVEEFDRIDQEKRLRVALARYPHPIEHEAFQDDSHPPVLSGTTPPLGPVEVEVALTINALYEDIDRASRRMTSQSDLEGPGFDFVQGQATGLRSAGLILLNELTRRHLPLDATAGTDLDDGEAFD